MPGYNRRKTAKAASNKTSSLRIDAKTEATDSLNLITRSSQSNGLELNLKIRGRLNEVSCEGAALIRLIDNATTLSSYQIAQLCNIGNASSIDKILINDNNTKAHHSGNVDCDLDVGLLQAMCTRLDELSSWVKKYAIMVLGDEFQLKHENLPNNNPDESPSKSCKKRARVAYNIEDHDAEANSETENEASMAKRQRTTDIDMLNAVFDAIGYRPTDPKQLVNDGFGSEELKAILKATEENAVNTLKLFYPFKHFDSDSKTVFFYRQLFAGKSRVLKILASGRV